MVLATHPEHQVGQLVHQFVQYPKVTHHRILYRLDPDTAYLALDIFCTSFSPSLCYQAWEDLCKYPFRFALTVFQW